MATPSWTSFWHDAGVYCEWAIYWLAVSIVPILIVGLVIFISYAVISLSRSYIEGLKFRQRGDNGLGLSRRERRLSKRDIRNWEHQRWSEGDKRFLKELGLED